MVVNVSQWYSIRHLSNINSAAASAYVCARSCDGHIGENKLKSTHSRLGLLGNWALYNYLTWRTGENAA